jgi:hypothetical protein
MERGLSILWIDAIWLSVQNAMPPPDKKRLSFAIKENGSGVVEPTNHELPHGTAPRRSTKRHCMQLFQAIGSLA